MTAKKRGAGFAVSVDRSRTEGDGGAMLRAPEEIDAIAVGLGPGSYTGIRSALAIAQGWYLARGVMAIGVSSAEAIAFEAWRNDLRGPVEVVIDAQRGEVYSVVYELDDGGFEKREKLEIRGSPRGTGRLIGPDVNGSFPSASAIGYLAQKISGGAGESGGYLFAGAHFREGSPASTVLTLT